MSCERTESSRPLKSLFIVSILIMATSCMSVQEREVSKPHEEAPVEDVYESIGNYVITGDIQGAIDAFETLNRENPDDPDTKNAYVKLLLAAGKLEEAAAITADILEGDPDNIGALFNSALLAGFSGEGEGRERYLLRVVELDPAHADAHALLGEFYLERKNYDAAEESFRASLAADPGNLVSNSGLSRVLRLRGDNAGALERLDRVIEIDPDFAFAWADRASIRASAGDTAGAEDDYSRAIELAPGFSWHYLDRANLRIRGGRLREALSDLDEAITLDPNHFYGYILRAGVREDLEMRAGAIEDYLVVLEKKPDYHFAYESLGKLLFLEERWDEAEEMFLKAYPYARERYEFNLLAGICRLKQGKDAEGFLFERVNLIPRDDLLYHVGRVFLEPGYESMAIGKIQQEGDTPEGTRALFYLAEHFLLTGSEDTALRYFFEIEERNIRGLIETAFAAGERKKISDIP